MLHDIRWTSQKIQHRINLIDSFIYQQKAPIPPFRFRSLNSPSLDSHWVNPGFNDASWDIIQPYDFWGSPRTNFVLRTNFTVPPIWGQDYGENTIAIYLPIGIAGDFSHPEALVYIDGKPYAACDRHHQEVLLPEACCDGNEHTLALHGWTGIGGSTVGDMTQKLQMNPCEVVTIHQPTRDFIALSRVALGISAQLEERDPVKHHLLTSLDEAFKILDIRNLPSDDFYTSLSEAQEVMQLSIRKSGPSLDVDISAIGHAHIDVAWLWTLAQSRQKAGRTFHNVLRLMESFPEYIFAQSQPQLYDYIRQDFPALFDEIKSRVKEGRWETIGGMWVEADCNLSGSESLARQFLLGRNFFRDHFGVGVDSNVLWLPDVFGYAWNLPQLIKEAGLDYFFTIKIGWNQYNRLPYDSFWWQGLDGTKVLTHFSTTKDADSPYAATYNADASPSQTIGTWINFQQKDYGPVGKIPPMLMSYGFGDGGGGPTREMLENIREMGNFPATPKLQTSKISHFFKKLEAVSHNLPTWNGELYLEYHRGTYTTQARNKRANRKSEFLLHDAEFLATYASLLDPDYVYPQDQFTKAWQLVCLNQFHDIIPGSSIAPVYQESLQQYDLVSKMTTEIRDQALSIMNKLIKGRTFVVNPTSFTRNEAIQIDGDWMDVGELSPYSVLAVPQPSSDSSPHQLPNLEVSPTHLENAFLRVELNQNGDITRLFDKTNNREILPEGVIANQFLAFEDIPLSWDAWDIDIYYDDKVWLAEPADSVKVIEANPYSASIEIKRKILTSVYTQKISLAYNRPRLDFETHIDWQERQTLLKVAFPVDVLSPTATYEIQWGNVERPTHRNTSWDWARFESVAQKWVDLSEGNFGISLLNDCKYGHDIHDNIIRLTLLRGTTVPDPDADRGKHSFKYSLLPHAGNWGPETVREAYAINDPLIVASGVRDQPQDTALVERLPSLVSVDKTNIVIETIKRAEDGSGVIVRMYEYQRQRGPFTLSTAFPLAKAWRVNILEEIQEEILLEASKLSYNIKPYQILTLKLVPEK